MTATDDNLSILNPVPQKLPGPSLVHDLVARNVPVDRTAIEYLAPGGNIQSYTYAELHEQSDHLARCLRQISSSSPQSAGGPIIVPLLIDQCPELYIGELAVLKAGGAFCPLPIDAPAERIRFICQDVQAKVVLTLNRLRVRLPKIDSTTIIAVDDERSDVNDIPLPANISPSQTAYIMYTSGSTGKPKGVLLSHSAATQALLAHDRHIPEFDKFLQFASPTFDVSVFEIFFPLFRGRTLVCGERRQLLTDLPGFINRMNVDAIELTPSVASNLIRGRENVPNLRLLLTIGEMLKRDVVEAFGGARDQDSILYGMYGPTEATIHCTLQVACVTNMPVRNIGHPLDTVSAFVVAPAPSDVQASPAIELLPLGEEGELAVGGYQLADGYLNRPEQTDSAFVDHPEYGRLYRTGDRARLTSDGVLECLGRLSGGQVKLRGQRIELGEIEYAASRTPGCQIVVAEVIEGALVVFCVCDDATRSREKVLDECRKWLPPFMVPADVLFLDELPYLDSGKADRKTLRSQWLARKPAATGEEHNLTPRLKRIIDAVSSILETPIDRNTRLSSVGLDSLTAIRLASELSKADLPRPNATDLLSSRTVNDIDSLIETLLKEGGAERCAMSDCWDGAVNAAVQTAGISKDKLQDAYMASPIQAAMIAETMRNNAAYCNTVELQINHTTVDKVSSALRQLVDCYSILRAGFIPLEGHVITHAVVVWKELKMDQILYTEATISDFFINNEEDLLHPCSFRVVQQGLNVRLTVRIHHSLYDQWSMDILRADLSLLLREERLAPRPSFAHVANQYVNHLDPNQNALDLDFWNEYLRDFSPSLFPSINGKVKPAHVVRTQRRKLEVAYTKLRDQSGNSGLSPPTMFQAAMAYLLSLMTAAGDVTLGVVYSGRHLPIDGIEDIFGPCLNTLPLRVDLSSTRTCSDLLRLIHTTNQSLQSHALTSLSTIKNNRQDLREVQLFDSLFIWQESTHRDDDQLSVVEIDSVDHHGFNFVLELFPVDDQVDARVTYRNDLITEDQINVFLNQLSSIAHCIANQPIAEVATLHQCLNPDLLSISNPDPTSLSDGLRLLESLERFAEEQPTAPAVMFADSLDDRAHNVNTINYRDFHNWSSALAKHYQTVGLRPGELVCICTEKSVLMYVSIIAAIKAGAGYVPLVPETPRDRVISILEQSAVKFCVCDSETTPHFQQFADLTIVNISTLSLSKESPPSIENYLNDNDVAYTCFTSGDKEFDLRYVRRVY
jgi:ferricrocin synthase